MVAGPSKTTLFQGQDRCGANNCLAKHLKKIETFKFQIKGKEVSIGSVLCYEEFSDKISTDMKAEGADLLVVTSNNQQIPEGLDLASFFSYHRAAETDLPLIRATNTGISEIISSKGKLVGKLPPNTEGVLVEKIWI